jgi:hypothetical protein
MFEYDLFTVGNTGAAVRYSQRVILPDGDRFETFVETDDPQIMPYPFELLKDAHEAWQVANARCNVRIHAERQALLESQKATEPIDPATISTEDIDVYFEKHGRGTHLLEYEFSPDTEEPIDYIRSGCGRPSRYWCWTHKLTNVSVKRFATSSGKSFDSGRLSKNLASISERINPLAYARAQKVLLLNDCTRENSVMETAVPVVLCRSDLLRQQVSNLEHLFYLFCTFLIMSCFLYAGQVRTLYN